MCASGQAWVRCVVLRHRHAEARAWAEREEAQSVLGQMFDAWKVYSLQGLDAAEAHAKQNIR